MIHVRRKAVLAIALALLLPALVQAEDLTIVSTVTTGKGAPLTSTQYLSTDKVRTSDGETDTILDLASGRLLIMNNRKKEYSETTLAEIKAAMQQLEASMAGNPIMEKMMGKVPEISVTRGTAPRKVAGYDTEHYVLSMGDNFRSEVWAAPALPLPTQYFDARSAVYALMGPVGKRLEKMGDEMRKIKGFPLATSTSMKIAIMKQDSTAEATEVRKGPIPASAFTPPPGFKKVEAPFQKNR